MAKDSPSMAKNKIRRSLVAILDPHPSMRETDELWSYFNSSCAYCGALIERSSRVGHLDHLVSSAFGGSNDIHNHVLSCGRCNGDEKREEDWQTFLSRKAASAELAETRRAHIRGWLSRARLRPLSADTASQAEAIIQEALANYETAVKRIR